MNNVYSILFIVFLLSVRAAAAQNTTGNRQVSVSTYEKKFVHPDRIRYDSCCLTIDGRDIFIYSAAFHYFRCPQELWRDRFKKLKEAGFNTVETYVPWNWHEINMPDNVNDFSQCDFTDLKAWLKMAQEEFGFFTIVRPGPFICAEWAGGAYPRWLAKFCPQKYDASFWLRSDDPEHIKWSKHWYDAVCPIFAEEQITNKPKGAKGIIMVQLENEYVYFDMASEGKIRFLKALYQAAKSSGIEVPLFTCVTPEARDCKDPEVSQVFDMDNQYLWWKIDETIPRIADLKREQPDAPAFVSELQGGWFSTVGGKLSEDAYLDGNHAQAIALMNIAAGATGLNFYMLFGGTHFAGWGARRMTTTYDYGAAIKENGGIGEKYLAAKSVGEFISLFGDKLTRSQTVSFVADSSLNNFVIGIRQATDGTRFVFIFNKNKDNSFKDDLRLILNDQSVITFNCELAAHEAKVLVLPSGESNGVKGKCFPHKQDEILRPGKIPATIRIANAYKRDENFNTDWLPLGENLSMPDMDVNDCRYSLYRSRFSLTDEEVKKYGTVVFDMFSDDPLYIQVNGIFASRVSTNEFNNKFNCTGLLYSGSNEIIVLYENQGHAHGYKPMEEVNGMHEGGLGPENDLIVPVEMWGVKKAAENNEKEIFKILKSNKSWKKIVLDTETINGLATLQIAGLAKPKWPAAWILQGKSGTAVYRTKLNFTPDMISSGKTVLEFGCIDELGILYINGKRAGEHTEWDKPFVIDIARFIKPGINIIAVAVTNEYGAGGILKAVCLSRKLSIDKPLQWEVAKDLAGVTHEWILDSSDLKDWQKISLDITNPVPRKGNNIQPKGKIDALFTWYRVEFELPEAEKDVWIPWRLIINASGTGYMWLNGQNIGRHWEVGPQREFFLPECWLKSGKDNKNVLILGLRQSPENGAKLNAMEISPYPDDCEVRK